MAGESDGAWSETHVAYQLQADLLSRLEVTGRSKLMWSWCRIYARITGNWCEWVRITWRLRWLKKLKYLEVSMALVESNLARAFKCSKKELPTRVVNSCKSWWNFSFGFQLKRPAAACLRASSKPSSWWARGTKKMARPDPVTPLKHQKKHQ